MIVQEFSTSLSFFSNISLMNCQGKGCSMGNKVIFFFHYNSLKIIKDKLFSHEICYLLDLLKNNNWAKRDKEKKSFVTLVHLPPNEINCIIRQTASAAGKTAGTCRFCFLGYRE